MENKNVNDLINEEMMRVNDEEIRSMCHTLWTMYTLLLAEGFTKQQAMSLIKEMIRPKVAS